MPSRFRYHAHAFAASGRLTVPFDEVIVVQAAAVLPEIGGYGSAHAKEFRHRNILAFEAAHTEVTGSSTHLGDDRYSHSILSKCTMEGLNIMSMVTADRIVANVITVHDGDQDSEPSFRLSGTRFEGLKILGKPVEVDLCVEVYDRHDKHASLSDAYRSDPAFRHLFDEANIKRQYPGAPEEIQKWFHKPSPKDDALPATKGFTSTSLVRKLEGMPSGVKHLGHVIHIEGFGQIRLAELQIGQHGRQVTMVQVNLGCPVRGELCMVTSGGDGVDW